MSGLQRAGGEVGGEGPGLQAWLGHELEMRGIDAVIYTRYILSLLQQEWQDLEEDLDLGFRKTPRHPRRKGRQPRHHSPLTLSPEEIKKLAAIRCLLAVSDEVNFSTWI